MPAGWKITKWNAGPVMSVANKISFTTMQTATLIVKATTQQLLSQKGTGRTYRKRTVTHTASAPGKPPAVDTGRLRSSIDTAVLRHGDNIDGYVFSNVKYARFLEVGTVRMEKRPYLRPAVIKEAKRIRNLFKKASG